jgi:hypothetical protein
MLQVLIELPETTSIKDKRRIVNSLKDRLRTRFRLSVAEVDLQDSLGFAQLGAAMVAVSREFGEQVMHKALLFLENHAPGRIQDVQIHTEHF